MAVRTRSAIIAEARRRAGRQGQEVSLMIAFDEILEQITQDYPVLRNIAHPFTTVANQTWVALPSDYRSWEQAFYDDDFLHWIEPEEYFYRVRAFSDTASAPSKFTIAEDESRLYLWNKPSESKSCHLYYAALHPKVDKSIVFTSGGTYEIRRGDIIIGALSTATMVVSFVRLTSGSWAGGDAVGIIMGASTGTFQAENVNVGANTNVATLAGAAITADNFQHFLGGKFDKVIIAGVKWKCLELLSDKSISDNALVNGKEKEFQDLLDGTAGLKLKSKLRTGYRGF
jgi:hypothetical protein